MPVEQITMGIENVMKSIVQVVVLTLLSVFASFESNASALQHRCGGTFNLCGFIDSETKVEVIPFTFESTRRFVDGRAAVRVEGRWGFIDETGQLVIPPIYDAVGDFNGGVAEFKTGAAPQQFLNGQVTALGGGLVGLIDRDGGTVLDAEFGRIWPLTSSVFIASNPDPKEFLRELRSGFLMQLIGKKPVGLYHKEKGWIVEPSLFVRRFGNEMFWASLTPENEVYGLMRADGTWAIEPRFGHVQRLFGDGYAVVAATEDPSKPYRSGLSRNVWGAVDREGRIVIPLEHEWLSYSEGGYFITRKGRKQGLIDHKNRLLGGRYFDRVERPKNGKPPRAFEKGKWMSLTTKGEPAPDPLDGQVVGTCPHVTITKHGDLFELRGRDGSLIGGKRVKYKGSVKTTMSGDKTTYEFDCDQPLSFGNDVSMRYLLTDGTLMKGEAPFEKARRFQGGFALVQKGGKWGIVKPTGEFSVKPIYDRLYGRSGQYRAKIGEEEFWINAAGEKISKPQPTLEQRVTNLGCWGGAKRFGDKGLWGMKNADGEVIIPAIHRAVSCFRNGIAWVPDAEMKQWCPVGPTGKRPERPFCIPWYYPSQPTHTDPEKFDEDPFESSVLWMRAKLDFAAGHRDEPPQWVPWANAMSHSVVSP